MNTIAIAIALTLAAQPTVGTDSASVESDRMLGSDFVGVSGEGDIPASVLEVATVLVDAKHQSRWFEGVDDARILRWVSDTEYILYAHLGAPMPLTDRELVLDVTMTISSSGRDLRLQMRSVEDAAAPHTHYVRATVAASSFLLRPNSDGTTHVSAELHCDPRGSVPTWVVSAVQSRWAANTLRHLESEVSRGEAPAQPMLRERLAPSRLELTSRE